MGLSLVTRPLAFFLTTAFALTGTFARAADAGPQPSHYLPPGVAAPPADPPTSAPPTLTGSAKGVAKRPMKAAVKGPPRGQKKGPKQSRTTTVVLFHLNHRDTFTLRQRDMQGRPPKSFQKRFDRFLRCHYTNKQHAMNPRLVRLLYQTGRHWPGRRLEVVSGYRSPTVAKNPRSPHMKGLACDFRVAGVKNTELRDYLRRSMKKVGVGYYPNSSFVHLDVRKDRSAFWIDYSGPGERAMYSQTPAADLQTGRAESYHPTKIGDDWINDAPPDKTVPTDDESEAKTTVAPPGAVGAPALAGHATQPPQSATR
ncbi:MAG TPA: DUF882 domain-containing protein [Polyangia bacterium]|jgi:uncharacterized protein YcbK (DUF882 family)|nr:DUF882 domain-containing protein [Polyangia bacterium]